MTSEGGLGRIGSLFIIDMGFLALSAVFLLGFFRKVTELSSMLSVLALGVSSGFRETLGLDLGLAEGSGRMKNKLFFEERIRELLGSRFSILNFL